MSLSLEAIEELPPELTGALTFHLPLEVAALQLAGADQAVVAARIERRLTEAYGEGLIDPPLYRWAVQHYRAAAEGLLSEDAARRQAAFADVAALGDGLAGAAFHGLIRLGYGLWRARPAEVARGLAYLRTRRQVLVAEAPESSTARTLGAGDLGEAMPPLDHFEGATVFDLMNIAAGTEDATRLWGNEAEVTMARLASAALALVRRNPSSFVAVHSVTGLHGLCEVHHRVVGGLDPTAPVGESLLAGWWSAYQVALGAATLIMEQYPPEALAAPAERVDRPERLLAAAVASGDTHDVKLVLALQRLHELGLVTAADALQIGALKLAGTEAEPG